MLLKRKPAVQGSKGPDPAGTLYARLKKEIPVVRKQGVPPDKDPGSFSRYVCDLCHTTHPVDSLRQCGICGRWACPSCWKDEFYLCSSCNGILKLHTLEKNMK
jgi:hypothetical protein